MSSRRTSCIDRLRRIAVTCVVAIVVAMSGGVAGGCSATGQTDPHNDLNDMETARIQIKGNTFEVWLAQSSQEVQTGLMNTPAEALHPIPDTTGQGLPDTQRGMLFVFPNEQNRAFWMLNTQIPLDIAFINQDGLIVKTYTMAPLETRLYPSVEPAMYALEVRAGVLAELAIAPGDSVEIPNDVLKGGT